jgi:hypothetical protein
VSEGVGGGGWVGVRRGSYNYWRRFKDIPTINWLILRNVLKQSLWLNLTVNVHGYLRASGRK